MIVPSFSGSTGDQGDDIGTSARSYLRQVSAWRRMTRMSEEQQGLTLYQHLTDKAWIDAERLDVDRLATKDGVEYLIDWIKDRYLDVQVTQIGRSLSGFFRGLHRKANQSVRDYMAEFDRAFARLGEVGCHLPDVAAAWVFVDRMGLEEQAELNLLASVGNQYSLKSLQQAAIVHDRGLRKPWETGSRAPRKEWTTRKPYVANMAAINEADDQDPDDGFMMDDDSQDYVDEDVAQDLYHAYMTHETAKAKYRESMKLRGSDPNTLKQLAVDKLRTAKSKSFCAGCKRRGHWHRDPECPLNRGGASSTTATAGTSSATPPKDSVKPSFPCHVVNVTWEITEPALPGLLAITDTACSRSVAGAGWIDLYLIEARKAGCEPFFLNCNEAFRFGASKVFVASYAIVLCFELGAKKVCLKVAVVNGEVPLLVSRPALGKMGMVIDVEHNRASFRALQVEDMELQITDTGHPAFPIQPSSLPGSCLTAPNWEQVEIQIFPPRGQYIGASGNGFLSDREFSVPDSSDPLKACATSWMVSTESSGEVEVNSTTSEEGSHDKQAKFKYMFYPKKIGLATKNLLLDVTFKPETFASWWSGTKISNDFWVENEDLLVRVHVIPRRSFFSPTHWRTTDVARKHALLQSLGAVRTIHAVSCKTFREFPVTHGTWDHDSDDSCLPVLWVGRTVFRRRMLMPALSFSTSRTRDGSQVRLAHRAGCDASKDAVGVHQGGIDQGSQGEELVVQRVMDCHRDQITDPGRPPRAIREPPSGCRDEQTQRPGTQGEGHGARLPHSPVRHQGHADEDPPRPEGNGATEHSGVWTLQGQGFQGYPGELQNMGTEGSVKSRQPIGGTCDVRELVARRASSLERCAGGEDFTQGGPRLPGSRAEREDSVHRGCEFHGFMGHDHQGEHRESVPGSEGEEHGDGIRNPGPKDAPNAENSRGLRGDDGDPHGPGDPAQRGRGGEVPRGETGDLEGQARDLAPQELKVSETGGHHDHKDEYDLELQSHHLYYQNTDPGRDESNQEVGLKEGVYTDSNQDHEDDEEIQEYFSSMNLEGNGDVFQCQTFEVSKQDLRAQCEILAKKKMKEKAFGYQDLQELVRVLPLRKLRRGKALQRSGGESIEYFIGGLYTHGPFVGLTKTSYELPWTIKYLNSFVRNQGAGEWTSFVLFRNTETGKHTDKHNLIGSTIKTVSFGDFSGGGLWLQGKPPEGSDVEISLRDGLEGYIVNTKEKIFCFDGKIPHATEAWEGERWTLSCYVTRGYPKSTVVMRDELRELRFPLRGVPLGKDDPGPQAGHRPAKSVRKGLWKKAGRLAALTAWCTAAATTWLSGEYPLGRDASAVALFEIGGYNKTIEVTDIDYLAAEPYGYQLDPDVQWNPLVVQETVRDLLPAVLWIHADVVGGILPSILPYVYEQVDHGRQLVLEAPPGHPCWDTFAVKELIEKYPDRWRRRRDEPHLFRVNDYSEHSEHRDPNTKVPEFLNYMVGHRGGGRPEDPEESPKVGAGAISFEGGSKIAPEVKSSLRRLHQNLGHPSNVDLARHLRLAGADPAVIEATKKMSCQVCARNQRGHSAKPASLPNILDFNQLVAVDAFYVYDAQGEKVELMMAIDIGTGYVSAGRLQGHSTATMEASFCTIWSNTFGAPGTVVIDLESGLQAGFGRYSEWHGTRLRPIAGQAHWQNGAVERAIRTWKEIWVKLVDQYSATYDEAEMIMTAVNAAMNTLRRDAGFSPAQAVWGRNPKLPDEIHNNPQDEQVEHIISVDRARAREHTIRTAAKEAYFKCQNDARLRKGLLQRSRVAGPELQLGCHVFFYRKPKNNKKWSWHGPGVIIGREGPNAWVSFAGRCHLVAPEHTRLASGEELGEAFTLRATQEDLHRLLDQDFGDEEIYDAGDVEMEEDPALPAGDGREEGADGRGEGSRRRQDPGLPSRVPKRHRVKGPEINETHEVPNETYMMKLAKTARGKEKALEKEIPWSLIPPEQYSGFKEAEKKQWLEHVNHDALQPLSVTDSREILKNKPSRVLGSRFAYRDKLWSRRRAQPDVGWKPKARLVIAGHRDPDLTTGLATHAPTISRQGIHLLLQILASNLSKGWRGFAGDVTAAFLCGEDLVRELYLRQPKTGLGDLHPEQLLRIKKPIFGLVDSPAAWWNKFQKVVKHMKITHLAEEWIVVQSSLDHCIFMVQKVNGEDANGSKILDPPSAYLGVHVDDVLLIGESGLCELLKTELSRQFPIQDWEADKFDYVGSYIDIGENYVKVSQASYATTRLFEVETTRDEPDHFEASEVQKHDNQSLIGALSWMACQTRPDLQVGVSMSQQRQKAPTVGDVKFTNQLARRALEHREQGLVFYPIDLDSAVLLCYHDAGWANVPQSDEDPYYKLNDEENEKGLIRDGPYARKEAKTKRANSTIASQLGGLYVLSERSILHGEAKHGTILDWKSGACERVCRSTFAAETMACGTATETGDFIVRFLETLLTGKLARDASRFEMRYLSDCRSLYDHLTRDGVPRVPTCKRLAIDLAGIREDLKSLGRIAWVPTEAQLADILTKPLRAEGWWTTVRNPIRLTFREETDFKSCTESSRL